MEPVEPNDAPVSLVGGQAHATECRTGPCWAGLAACRLLLRAQSSKFPACDGCNTKIVSPNIVFAREGCNSNSMFL